MKTHDADIRSLAERVALVRAVGAVASFAVIHLDHTVPHSDTAEAIWLAALAAAAFTIYSAVAYIGLSRRWISLRAYEVTSPLLDVLFASLLIAATDGYRSPFNLWMIFAVLGTAVSRRRWLPLATVQLGVSALLLTALTPQDVPMRISTLILRTAFLFGIAAVVAFIGRLIANQADVLAAAARQAERKKVMDRLHDTHVQTLTAIGRRADAAQMTLDKGLQPEQDLAEIRRLTALAGEEVRQMLDEDDEPDAAKLRKIVSERWDGRSSVRIADVLLSRAAWQALEMLVREGLNNARTHSGADAVILSLARDGEQVVCSLQDNGSGLKQGSLEGYGFGRIRELVEGAGGKFRYENREGLGVALTATFQAGDGEDRSTDR